MEPTEQNLRAWEEAHRRPAGGEPEEGLPAAIRERLPAVDGRHVLHVGARGAEAADLAALGALVTAVAATPEAAAAGQEAAPTAAWIPSDLHALPLELLRGRFHLVLAGEGTAARVRDAAAWAAGVDAALRPGGYLLWYDEHPVAACLDPLLHWRADYFAAGAPRLGELVTALARAGLVVRRLEELPSLRPARRDARAPGAFVLVAVRPVA